MKFLDVAVAVIIGLSAFVSLDAFSPTANVAASYALERQASARDSLSALIASPGVAWLQSASMAQTCALLASLSNNSVVFSATQGAVACRGAPAGAVASANLTLSFPSRTLVLEAWAIAKP